MITVLHYPNRDPDIYFGIDQKTENKIIRDLGGTNRVTRCSAEEWFGQDNPSYSVHHWEVKRNGK